jgi:tRNA threonylcarbamoyladenosine biosynthesis protein TsaE
MVVPPAEVCDGSPEWLVTATTDGADATRVLAAAVAGFCRPGDVVLLAGGLGAGKTTFAQGFARALGVTGPVTSPTFTLVRQYRCDRSEIDLLLHADVYRLDTMAEVLDLGIVELVEDGAVALVEWGDAVADVFGAALHVSLTAGGHGVDDERRAVVLEGHGRAWADRHGQATRAVAAFARVAADGAEGS